MALVTLSVMQAKALEVVITQAIMYLERREMIKDYTDEQCQILIDNAAATKKKLDERLDAH